MSEFKEKIERIKESVNEAMGGITDAPTVGMSLDQDNKSSAEVLMNPEPETEQEQETQQRYAKSQKEVRRERNLKSKLDQLSYEKELVQRQNQELALRLHNQEQLLFDKQNQLEENSEYKNKYYENNLQIREQAILSELKTAKENGDLDKEIALSRALAQVTAEQSTYGLYRSQAPVENQQPYQQYQQPYQQPYQQQPVNHEPTAYDEWLESNPWADARTESFDPSLRGEIEQISRDLDKRLKFSGNTEIIGTPQYYNTLNRIMSNKYNPGDSEPEEEEEEPQYAPSHVAPVSRRTGMADAYVNTNPQSTKRMVNLTEEEYKIARNLQIKLPNGGYASGEEAVRRWAEAKRRGGSGGSPTRFIAD